MATSRLKTTLPPRPKKRNEANDQCSDHAVLPESFHRDAFADSLVSLVSTSNTATRSSLINNIQQPFVAAHKSFETLFRPDASIKVLAKKDYAFAHEAGVYSSKDNKVWFTSNLLLKDGKKHVEISRVSLETGEVDIVEVDRVRLGNGGCRYREGILFCDQGTSQTPSQLVYCNFNDPSNACSILNNFNGRQFNSLNDVVVLEHPSGDLICFTDPPYGHEQGFRPACQLPPAVYAFDPNEGHVRMLADGFHHPNGIAFSPDGKTCYVTDTSHIHGSGRLDPSLPSTIHAFDVVRPPDNPKVPSLRNRRLFAFADCGVPDGIKCDVEGRVYAGCGDGIHVWNSAGLLIGRIVLGLANGDKSVGCANFCFVPKGLVCLSEDRIYHVDGLLVEGAGLSRRQ